MTLFAHLIGCTPESASPDNPETSSRKALTMLPPAGRSFRNHRRACRDTRQESCHSNHGLYVVSAQEGRRRVCQPVPSLSEGGKLVRHPQRPRKSAHASEPSDDAPRRDRAAQGTSRERQGGWPRQLAVRKACVRYGRHTFAGERRDEHSCLATARCRLRTTA